ncbi:MAG: hypothetical protein ACI9HY_003447, partial [Planctomycetaceae bacterium]
HVRSKTASGRIEFIIVTLLAKLTTTEMST